MSLQNRIDKIEGKISSKKQHWISVREKEGETIAEALERYRKETGNKLKEEQVRFWQKLPFKRGYFLLSHNWCYEDELMKGKKQREAEQRLNEQPN